MLKNTKRVMARYRRMMRLGSFTTDIGIRALVQILNDRDRAIRLVEDELERLGRKAGEE